MTKQPLQNPAVCCVKSLYREQPVILCNDDGTGLCFGCNGRRVLMSSIFRVLGFYTVMQVQPAILLAGFQQRRY